MTIFIFFLEKTFAQNLLQIIIIVMNNVPFVSFLMGLASMTYFHNFFVSILLYRSGQAHVSNILKIIFNFSGVAKSVITYASVIVLAAITQTQCSTLTYLSIIANFLYRQALAGFLLWRLKQIEYSTWDARLSFGLYLTRTILNLIILGYVRPKLTPQDSQDPGNSAYICEQGTEYGFLAIQLCFIGTDIIIDTFVTARLVQILNDGNRNAAEANSIIGRKRRKRTLFTAVLYWNFLRLTVDYFYNGITVLNTIGISDPVLDGLLCLSTIAQSYLITVDAEIVKVIEGRSPTDEWPNTRLVGNGGDDSGSTFSPPLPVTSRTVRETSLTSLTSRYQRIVRSWTSPPSRRRTQCASPTTWARESSTRQQQTASFRLDKGKFVVVSMQRLTFFEWANIVTGIDSRDGNDQGSETIGIGGFGGFKNKNKISVLSTEGSPLRPTRDRDTVEMVDYNNNSLPELAHLNQSRRGSDTSTMSNSSTQTKINDMHLASNNDTNYKHSFI